MVYTHRIILALRINNGAMYASSVVTMTVAILILISTLLTWRFIPYYAMLYIYAYHCAYPRLEDAFQIVNIIEQVYAPLQNV